MEGRWGGSKSIALIGAVAVCLLAAGPVHANLVTNGSFESGSPDPGLGGFATLNGGDNTTITGWTVNGPLQAIDWINGYWNGSDGTHSIDLDGYFAEGGVSTSFITVPGQVYKLSFDHAGNPDNNSFPGPNFKTFDVTSNSFGPHSYSFDATGMTHTSMGWETESFYFTASGTNTTLSFDSTTPGAWGPALDNVIVEAVPEPATLMLLGAGLSALGLLKRRKA